jgi:spermidine synthase
MFSSDQHIICTFPLHTPELALTRVKIAENQWLHLPLITKLKADCKQVFPTVEYAYTTIPTYPSGQIGFMVCCKDKDRNLKEPVRSFTAEEEERLCRYYNAVIHRASFVLPTFARAALK